MNANTYTHRYGSAKEQEEGGYNALTDKIAFHTKTYIKIEEKMIHVKKHFHIYTQYHF